MKKLLILVLSAIFTMSLFVGCGTKKEEVKKQEKPKQEQKQEQKDNTESDNAQNDNAQLTEIKPIFDLQKIVNSNKDDINKILGIPTEESENSIYNKNGFEIEINYKDDSVNAITLTPKEKIAFIINDESLFKALGLKYTIPDFENNRMEKWQNKFNVEEFTIFNKENNINYIYIITQK